MTFAFRKILESLSHSQTKHYPKQIQIQPTLTKSLALQEGIKCPKPTPEEKGFHGRIIHSIGNDANLQLMT